MTRADLYSADSGAELRDRACRLRCFTEEDARDVASTAVANEVSHVAAPSSFKAQPAMNATARAGLINIAFRELREVSLWLFGLNAVACVSRGGALQ